MPGGGHSRHSSRSRKRSLTSERHTGSRDRRTSSDSNTSSRSRSRSQWRSDHGYVAPPPQGREVSQSVTSSHTKETATTANGIAASCNVLAVRLAPVPKSELITTTKAAADLASSTPRSRVPASGILLSLPKPKNKVPIVKVFPVLEKATTPGKATAVVPKVTTVFPIESRPKSRKSALWSTPSSVSDAVPSALSEAKAAADAAAAAATAAAAAAATARHAATASTAAADAADAAAEAAKAAASVATLMSAARRRKYRS